MTMAAKKKKVTTQKVKKKKWFPIHAPKLFNEVSLGESYVTEESLLNGKYITANLSTITRSIRKQNVNMHFRVIKVADGKAYTEVIGYSLINAAIKRLVRRGRDKIADSFLAKTKDKKVIRIKPLIITSNRGTHSTQTALRLESRRVIREQLFTKNVEEIFGDIADGKLQKIIKESCAKIYPVRSIDIRLAKLEENTDVVITEDGVKTEAVKIRKKEKGEDLRTEEEKKAGKLPDDQFVSEEEKEDDSFQNADEQNDAEDVLEDEGDEPKPASKADSEDFGEDDEDVQDSDEQSADDVPEVPEEASDEKKKE